MFATWRLLLAAGEHFGAGFKALCGGEALPKALADELLDRGLELWNMYGPTETTVWSTCHRVVRGEGRIRVGRPIANTQIHVVDTGVLSDPGPPTRGDVKAPALLLWNVGLNHHVGPYRFNVDLARHAARSGDVSLRLDLSGRGDSDVRRDPLGEMERALDDLIEAIAVSPFSSVSAGLRFPAGSRGLP